MGTNTTEDTAREREESSTGDLDQTIHDFHTRLSDAAALLRREIAELRVKLEGPGDPKQFDKLSALIREAHGALGQINKIETEIALRRLDDKDALNLEDARAEILRRLARIAAACDEEGVSG